MKRNSKLFWGACLAIGLLIAFTDCASSQPKTSAAETAISNDIIVGKWVWNSLTVEFFADGEGEGFKGGHNGDEYEFFWEITKNFIYTNYSWGYTIRWRYEISGDSLTLYDANGNAWPLKR
jgi:hypothetical protein